MLFINPIAVFTFEHKANALQSSDWSHAVGGGGEAPLVRTPTPDTTNHTDGDGDVGGGDSGGDGNQVETHRIVRLSLQLPLHYGVVEKQGQK